ncbi:MAG: hypothetical protein JSW47_01270 [Phycisphaerales bacterium]|nr:MAG: hypothetical protein JSW47_01270 [Phycisphaerales bacterium]
MNSRCRIAFLMTVTLSISLSAARSESKAESEPEKKIEENFKVDWTRISYTRTVSLRNPEVSEYGQQVQGQDVSERLSLYCQVDILDPNFVLGISRAPMIEEIVDDKGGNIEIDTEPRSSFQTRYEAPRYRRRFVPPQPQAKWKTVVRSALKLPPKQGSRPQWVEEVEPSRIQIDLGIGTGEQSGEKISRVKGYFYALIAESFENVDVPFKKSDKWIRLTPDVEVQILEAFTDGSSYRLRTKGRPEGGGFRGMLSAESYMPARLVTSRQLIGPDGKPVRRHSPSRMLPFHIGGNSSGSGSSMGQIKKIRYVIAVNPAHYEIPFVLEQIPLPKP